MSAYHPRQPDQVRRICPDAHQQRDSGRPECSGRLLHDARIVKKNLMRFQVRIVSCSVCEARVRRVVLGLRGTSRCPTCRGSRARSARHDCNVGRWMSEKRRARRACMPLATARPTPSHAAAPPSEPTVAESTVRQALGAMCTAVIETTFGDVVGLRHLQTASRRTRHRLTSGCAGRPPRVCAASARAPPPRML